MVYDTVSKRIHDTIIMNKSSMRNVDSRQKQEIEGKSNSCGGIILTTCYFTSSEGG